MGIELRLSFWAVVTTHRPERRACPDNEYYRQDEQPADQWQDERQT